MKNKDKTTGHPNSCFPRERARHVSCLLTTINGKGAQGKLPGTEYHRSFFFYPQHPCIYDWHGCRVISLGGSKWKLGRLLDRWRRWKTLKKIHRENSVTGLFSFWCGECAVTGKYFAKKKSIKHFSWICGQDARKSNKWVRFLQPGAEELVAMSPFLVNEFHKNHGIRPAHIIPNAIDTRLFSGDPPLQRDIDILGAGSLIPLKQYGIFAEIIASLRQSFPNIKSLHCGDGQEKEKVTILLKNLELDNNLLLLGSKPHDEVLSMMQRAKIFLHTSSYEGFSTVCMEALYAGAHVISFCYPLDHPVPHWHVVKDAVEMKNKATEILQDPNRDHSPVLLYSMDDSAKAVMQLFEN
jgi:glycosyltransferase involved in cell wall biosynthesis